MLKSLKICIIFYFVILCGCKDEKPLISIFPLKNYDQTIAHWIKPTDTNFDIPFIRSDVQQEKMRILFRHYFGLSSPWHAERMQKILQHKSPDDLKTLESELIQANDNRNKSYNEIGYGENFRPHTSAWLNQIAKNINLDQFNHTTYAANQRAIAVDNLLGRALPTDDVSFYRHTLPGQGYPFDNLQNTAIWVGTPLYILGETRDHAWSLVLSPDVIAWVKTALIAKVDKSFIKTWTQAAEKKLIAITQTNTSVVDTQKVFRFSTYVGTLFPGTETEKDINILIPIRNKSQQAVISYAHLPKNKATSIPLLATPRHFSRIIQSLIGRPYGWGNSYFYNDCSAELKNLFAVFGVWLPRHSSEQVKEGNMTDLSSETMHKRIEFLMAHGKPYSTIVYLNGHVFLYIGNYPNPNSAQHESIPLTYQDMWGLSPHPASRRAVIGQSVIFPLLEKYPEDPALMSQASKKYFQMALLDQPSNPISKLDIIDLKDLIFP